MSLFLDPASRALPGRGSPVVVLGLGRSGEAAARRLLASGARVVVIDSADDSGLRERAAGLAGAVVRLGTQDAAALAGAALVIASPGVAPSSPMLSAAREAGIPVWSEVELAWRLARVPIVGVTGTNGKTTTTRMIAEALTASGMRAMAAGNIGHPLVDAATADLEVIVAELSSFQLHHIVSLRPRVAVLLDLADDHLDWHGSFEAYGADKARIFENQAEGDVAVFERECAPWRRGRARAVAFSAGSRGGCAAPAIEETAGLEDGWIVVPEGRVVETSRLRARGSPNRANAIAAAAAACAFGAAPASVGEALASFEPLPHRMELVEEAGGIAYVNDSKATNPHAALAALGGIDRAVLVAGGRNKGLDLSVLAEAAGRLRGVVALGESAPEVERVFAATGVPVEHAASMDEAVERATAMAGPGDTVLLSPACASFDLFADYKARGEAFRAAVKRLIERREA